ncbi:DegT/DnrJ/EryC1/StrS family aminotransferase [Microbacterium trichothecenolyticum]|uniref:UDP-4-amino-4-deoxy-L-arabinose--oxoglutarate aminotransferase n=1 Tax=Microbacterium trichothecenolyticum TaxID=69370 RepID=A0A0M2H470_MICTR|nr:DegT/DnrJ/EryC1/StrS family aminotransferase [Microbacterium trichothecenolyticum]KJL41237.1 UDP-4-amino-4-deoxy-L-arabinose--oxoglutarate aminotransferase [Microbacterium trichothecenolyticum]
MSIRYPLATTTWDDAEYGALQDVIASGRFTMGPQVRAFEEEFAAALGAKHAVMVNSGSSANLIALAAAVVNPGVDLNPGDEVIVPAVSWATTYYPVHQLGLTLRFVDVDLDTLNMDPELVAAAITPKTKAILAVNLLGNPADLVRLSDLASDNGLILLEDNCESLGATLDGRSAGTFGLAGTYSSFFSHHISTMEGGLVTTDDEYTYQAAVSLRAHGWTRELPAENLIHPKTGDLFDDLFRFVLPGYNVRPLEMSGALGRHQLAKLPELVAGRRANAARFVEIFGGRSDVRIQRENGASSWFGFSFILEGRLSGRRADVVKALGEAGIESRPIVAGNFARNPVMGHLRAEVPESLPAADRIHVDGLFVGNHHYPIPGELELLATAIDGV